MGPGKDFVNKLAVVEREDICWNAGWHAYLENRYKEQRRETQELFDHPCQVHGKRGREQLLSLGWAWPQ